METKPRFKMGDQVTFLCERDAEIRIGNKKYIFYYVQEYGFIDRIEPEDENYIVVFHGLGMDHYFRVPWNYVFASTEVEKAKEKCFEVNKRDLEQVEHKLMFIK